MPAENTLTLTAVNGCIKFPPTLFFFKGHPEEIRLPQGFHTGFKRTKKDSTPYPFLTYTAPTPLLIGSGQQRFRSGSAAE